MRNVISPFRFILKSCLLFICSVLLQTAVGQISYGGKPLPLHAGMGARSIGQHTDIFVEMPAIDGQAELRRSLQNQTNFKSLEFAYKFHPFLRPDNSGVTFITGNMRVWRVGIRSNGAFSLNILFSKFRLPPEAKLFVYNSDQSEILGSYTEKNNTELNMLPIQPITGDALIVEYQEPLEPGFKGEIEIGEVNHDFVGILRALEPRDPEQDCHPNLICYPEDIQPGSGVVGLIINGTFYCTGVLVNNTAEDGTPYLLTATHCLNNNYSFGSSNPSLWQKYGQRGSWHYDKVAGSIVAFFNYQSPLCDMDIRGPIQMTMASADSVLISENHDISLLKLKLQPEESAIPAEYQPYYLGWNANNPARETPFHGLHHPNGGIKKVAIEDDPLTIGSFDLPNYDQEAPNAHWVVRAWDTGATEGGSSGSPLLDREKRVVGTLTGGSSYCSSPKGPDYYASLSKFWNVQDTLPYNTNPISYYLDPENLQTKQIGGFNPYAQDPYKKSHNFKEGDKAVKYHFQSVPFFSTNNTFGYSEFAEQFDAKSKVQLRGVFLSSPSINSIAQMDIRIRVYSGENGPEQLLYEQSYNYNYAYYTNTGFPTAPRDMRHSVENYIRFDVPVTVSGTFYISYYDKNGVSSGFSTFNADPRKIGSGWVSTTWMKNTLGWVKSSENVENPINTALLISPYVIGNLATSVESEKKQPKLSVYYSKEMKRIFIESNYELEEWEIYYSSGIKIHHETTDISLNRTSYSSAHLPKGIYIVRVRTNDGITSTKKVLVT